MLVVGTHMALSRSRQRIGPTFTRLHVPPKNLTVERDAFKTTLRAMYDADEGDAELVFSVV